VPWKETGVVNERMRFVARLEDGERMTDVCREFGVSRKTGYKLWERYKQLGAVGLFDEVRRPERIPHKTPAEVENLLLAVRDEHPTWGPRKLRAWCQRHHADLRFPAPSTIGEILDRHGRVQPRRRRQRTAAYDGPLTAGTAPNGVWCADFKGQIRLATGAYSYPLTITDNHSRYLLACEGLESTKTVGARGVFEAAFRTFGLPNVIRTDNGTPFSSRGLAGLSHLSVWWLRLGIRPERIEPGHPEQNGQHERMHLTLKQETARPAAASFLQQQERFDRFVEIFNHQRPHEALGQRPPADLYVPSVRAFPEQVLDLTYPLHDETRAVMPSGHIRLRHRSYVFVSEVLRGQLVGLRELARGKWLLSFMHLDLGHVDWAARRFEPLDGSAAQRDRQVEADHAA